MRLTAKPLISVPVLLALAAAAFLAMWAWGPAGGAGFTEKAGINGIIEWTVLDASGKVKAHDLIRNATTDEFKDDVRNNLGVDGTVNGASDVDIYDEIAICSNNPAAGVACTLNATADIAAGNPQEATQSAPSTGVYTVVATFLAQNNAVTIAQLQLANGNSTAGSAPTSTEIGAQQSVTITLAVGDSLIVTWTITVT